MTFEQRLEVMSVSQDEPGRHLREDMQVDGRAYAKALRAGHSSGQGREGSWRHFKN